MENIQKVECAPKEEGGPMLPSPGGGPHSYILFYLAVEVIVEINKAEKKKQ